MMDGSNVPLPFIANIATFFPGNDWST